MDEHQVSRSAGEQWSNTYRNPAFDLDEDQLTTDMLVSDIRRATRIALIVIVAFSIVLMIGADVESGVNLLLMVGGPILLIASAGWLLGWYRRRSSVPHISPRAE